MANQYQVVPYSCVFIDALWLDFLNVGKCFLSSKNKDASRKQLCHEIESKFSRNKTKVESIVCLSVRTGFDLFLRTVAFPPGAEIIMTAINIPSMVAIVTSHGLVPVPLDIDANTLAPSVSDLQKLIRARTVAVMVAHLFGKLFDCSELVACAHANGLLFIEDRAEVFCGYDELGNERSDLVLFSFGVMKNFTCFGGAVVRVSNSNLLMQMRNLYSFYEIQTYGTYLSKVLKYLCIALVLNQPCLMRPGMAALRSISFDYKAFFVNLLRGFPTDLTNKIRSQPSDVQIAYMHRRLVDCSSDNSVKTRIERALCSTKAKGDFVVARLSELTVPEKLFIPGTWCLHNNYWLFPIVVPNPDVVTASLERLGIDAYRGTTQLTVIEGKESPNSVAKLLMDGIIYLPVHKNVPYKMLETISSAVAKCVTAQEPSTPLMQLNSKL